MDSPIEQAGRGQGRPRGRGRFAVWAAACAFLAATAGSARAEVRSLNFPVRGMICPLCTRGVEESIKRLRGVAAVRAELGSGRVQVDALPGQSLSIEEVRQRALRAGFPVNGEMDVLARGRFAIGTDGRITFRVAVGHYGWQVLEGHQLLFLFRSRPTLRGEYLVGFRLHERTDSAPPAIALTRVEPVVAPVGRAAGP